MSRLRWQQRIYILGVIGGAVAALSLTAATAPLPAYDDAIALVILFAMSTLAVLFPVHIGVKLKMTVDDLPNFAAAILLGPFAAMAIAAGSKLVGSRYRAGRMPWYNRAFNAAAATLAAGAGAATFDLLDTPGRALLQQPFAVLIAAAAMYLVQTLLVDVVVALQMRRRLFESWWQSHRRDMPTQAALFVLGALAAAAAQSQPLALVLFAVPMAITLVTLRESAQLREQTRSLGLEEVVEFRGPAGQEEVARVHLPSASVFVLPCVIASDGDRDGLPTTLLEAMARGVPVVSTRLSGIPEAVPDLQAGLLAEPGDVEGLTEAIARTLSDQDGARHRARAARRRAEELFDGRKNVSQLLQLFNAVTQAACARVEAQP